MACFVVFQGIQHFVKDVVLHQNEVFPVVNPAVDAVVVNGVERVAFFVDEAFNLKDGGVGHQLLKSGHLGGFPVLGGQRNPMKER